MAKTNPIIAVGLITPKLMRRMQGGREVSPLYIADRHDAAIVTHACEEAERAGYRSVTVGDQLYVKFSEWYAWSVSVADAA